jgi:hypothetical protein
LPPDQMAHEMGPITRPQKLGHLAIPRCTVRGASTTRSFCPARSTCCLTIQKFI